MISTETHGMQVFWLRYDVYPFIVIDVIFLLEWHLFFSNFPLKSSFETQLPVGDKTETVRFFHCYKRGVDRVFVDHPIFLEKVSHLHKAIFIVF